MHAEASGDPAARRRVIGTLLTNARPDGPTPVAEAIDRVARSSCGSTAGRPRARGGDQALPRALLRDGCPAGRSTRARSVRAASCSTRLNQLNVSCDLPPSRRGARGELAGDRSGAERELLARWSYFAAPAHGTADAALRSAAPTALRHSTATKAAGTRPSASRQAVRDLPLGRRMPESRGSVSRSRLGSPPTAGGSRRGGRARRARAVDAVERRWRRPNDSRGRHSGSRSPRCSGAAGRSGRGRRRSVAAALGLYELKGNVAAAARVREAAD